VFCSSDLFLSAARIFFGGSRSFVFFHRPSAARARRQQLAFLQLHNVAALSAFKNGVFLNHREWQLQSPFVEKIIAASGRKRPSVARLVFQRRLAGDVQDCVGFVWVLFQRLDRLGCSKHQ
jgi:hypothetical protein